MAKSEFVNVTIEGVTHARVSNDGDRISFSILSPTIGEPESEAIKDVLSDDVYGLEDVNVENIIKGINKILTLKWIKDHLV